MPAPTRRRRRLLCRLASETWRPWWGLLGTVLSALLTRWLTWWLSR